MGGAQGKTTPSSPTMLRSNEQATREAIAQARAHLDEINAKANRRSSGAQEEATPRSPSKPAVPTSSTVGANQAAAVRQALAKVNNTLHDTFESSSSTKDVVGSAAIMPAVPTASQPALRKSSLSSQIMPSGSTTGPSSTGKTSAALAPPPEPGLVYTWGSGEAVGVGDEMEVSTPAVLATLEQEHGVKTVSRVAAGPNFTLFLSPEGRLYSCGNNDDGQLGVGDEQPRSVPTFVVFPAGVSIARIACGYCHAAACDTRGVAYTWGSGLMGRLGTGSEKVHPNPTRIDSLAAAGAFVSNVACGQYNTGFVTDDGRLFVTGSNDSGQLGLGDSNPRLTPTLVPALSRVAQVSFGDRHVLVLDDAGRVRAAGDNEFGQLGIRSGDTETRHAFEELPKFTGASAAARAVQVACGERHSSVVAADGGLYTFGHWESCQLGNLVNSDAHVPTQVAALSGKPVAATAVGPSNSLAVLDDGSVWSWGYSIDQPIPKPVPFDDGPFVQAAAVGAAHFAAITKRTDEVVEFPWSEHDAEVHSGQEQAEDALVPVPALRGKKLVQLDARFTHFGAVTAAGELYLWGQNDDGQLGMDEEEGSREDRAAPTLLRSLRESGARVVAVSCGYVHTACVTDDGGLWTWGQGLMGRLGHGDERDRSKPERVRALVDLRERAARPACGQYMTLCVSESGKTFRCGVGIGDQNPALAMAQVGGGLAGKRAREAACGDRHCAVLADDGAVYTWGDGDTGALGHGDAEHKGAPKAVEGALKGKRVLSVACGERHTIVATEGGEVYAWGCADTGQLGNGDSDARDVPAPRLVPLPKGGPKMKTVLAGPVVAAALDEKGGLWAWGQGIGEAGRPLHLGPFQGRACTHAAVSSDRFLAVVSP
eukprot:tig00001110_g7079.t1